MVCAGAAGASIKTSNTAPKRRIVLLRQWNSFQIQCDARIDREPAGMAIDQFRLCRRSRIREDQRMGIVDLFHLPDALEITNGHIGNSAEIDGATLKAVPVF